MRMVSRTVVELFGEMIVILWLCSARTVLGWRQLAAFQGRSSRTILPMNFPISGPFPIKAAVESLESLDLRRLPEESPPSVEQPFSGRSPARANRAAGAKSMPFARTNRLEGMMKWVREVKLLSSFDGSTESNDASDTSGVFMELAKELLYSGIPEQVPTMFLAYSALHQTRHNTTVEPMAQRGLIIAVLRSYIALGDVDGATNLMQQCGRQGVTFDADSKCLIMADLAVSGPSGLDAALKMRLNMLQLDEKINPKGSAGILKGIWMHG